MARKTRRHPQPLGSAGIAHSLDSVAQKAVEGGQHEAVRAWATHVLKACGWPKGARARAECLLADTRKYAWIPDPVDLEFIPAPWLMMPNLLTGEEAIYLADDCDGLTARWVALCLAAGIRCQIVGYSFSDDKQISHVLGAVWDDAAGVWLDGDPSFQDLPLGKTEAHTWEQRRELPAMVITCDDVACDMRKGPDEMSGTVNFLSVGAPKVSADAVAPERIDLSPEAVSDIATTLNEQADMVESAWDGLKTAYDQMRAAFASGGLTSTGDLAMWGWGAEDQQRAVDLGIMAQLAAGYLRDAANGARSIWRSEPEEPEPIGSALVEKMEIECETSGGSWDPANVKCRCPPPLEFTLGKGCTNSAGEVPFKTVPWWGNKTWAIQALPGDTLGVALDASGAPVLVDAKGAVTHAKAPAPNTIGSPVAVAIAIGGAIMYAAIAYAIAKALEYFTDLARAVMDTWLENKVMDCYGDKSISPEECQKRVEERRKYALKRRELDAKEKEAGGAPTTALAEAVKSAVWVSGAVLTIYGLVKLVSAYGGEKKK